MFAAAFSTPTDWFQSIKSTISIPLVFDDVTYTMGCTVRFIMDKKKIYIKNNKTNKYYACVLYARNYDCGGGGGSALMLYGCEMARKQFQCRKTLKFFFSEPRILFFLGYVNLLLLILCLFDCIYTSART